MFNGTALDFNYLYDVKQQPGSRINQEINWLGKI
jgi:hypothetical protein